MSQIHFIGELLDVNIQETSNLSLTFTTLPGNDNWHLVSGQSFGETCISKTDETTGISSFNHPIDINYTISSPDGWPQFIVEAWERSDDGIRSFLGCGSVWMPTPSFSNPSQQDTFEIFLWKPQERTGFWESISEFLLPSTPSLVALRELFLNPFMRSHTEVTSVGVARVSLRCLTSGLQEKGAT